MLLSIYCCFCCITATYCSIFHYDLNLNSLNDEGLSTLSPRKDDTVNETTVQGRHMCLLDAEHNYPLYC